MVTGIVQRSSALLVAWLLGCASLGLLEREVHDLFLTLSLPRPSPGEAAPAAVDGRVVVVDVSDRARGIIGRGELARVLARLVELGAWSVGLDVMLEGPGSPDEDRALAAALRRFPQVVIASRYLPGTRREVPPVFAADAGGLGLVNLPVDPDGFLRYAQHFVDEPGFRARHSLELVMASMLLNHPAGRAGPVDVSSSSLRLRGGGRAFLDIPVDARGLTAIQYQGMGGTIPVLHWSRLFAPGVPSLAGKAAVVGDARIDDGDSYPLPFHRDLAARIAGVEIHAQNLAGILAGSRLVPLGGRAGAIACLLAAVVGMLAASRLRAVTLACCGPAAAICALAAAYAWYEGGGALANPTGWIVAAAVAAASQRRPLADVVQRLTRRFAALELAGVPAGLPPAAVPPIGAEKLTSPPAAEAACPAAPAEPARIEEIPRGGQYSSQNLGYARSGRFHPAAIGRPTCTPTAHERDSRT